MERRRREGKEIKSGARASGYKVISSKALVNAYNREADRQRLMLKKTEITHNRLVFIVEAMRKLLADENFVTLLRAEDLVTMPHPLAELISARVAT